jgi:glutamate carboxypeptidase
MHTLLRFCAAEQPWLVDTITTLVGCESPTTDKAAVDACGRILKTRLTAMGGRVHMLPRADAGDHLVAEFGGGTRQILVLGHVDTVWPIGELRRQPIRNDGERIYGPGVYDMKAGLAIAMLAVRALAASRERIPGRIVFLFTSDEETGSASSRSAIEAEARRSAAVLVVEPALPGGAVKTARKGCGQYTVHVSGVAAHAGVEPEKGASAILELARLVAALPRLADPDRGLSLNVGTIRGGTRPNVVPDDAVAEVDVRVSSMVDAARVDAALRALRVHDPRTSIEVTGGFERPPLERTPAVVDLYHQARAVAADLGRCLDEGATGGGSDGNFTAALGVPTLDGLGAIGGGAHAIGEHVEIVSLPWRAALLAGLLRRILAEQTD